MDTMKTVPGWENTQPLLERRPGINKLILCVLNALLVVPFCIESGSLIGIITAAVVLVLLSLRILASKAVFSASAFLPLLILGDILIFTGVHFEELLEVIREIGVFPFTFSTDLIGAAIGIVLFGIIGIVSKGPFIWMGGLAGILIGSVLIFDRFGGRLAADRASLLSFSFDYEQGRILYSLFLFTSLIYIVIMQFHAAAHTQKKKAAMGVGVIIMVLTSAYLVLAPVFLAMKAPVWHELFWQALHGWRLPVVCGVLLLLCIVLYIWNKGCFTPDLYAAVTALIFLIGVKLITTFYFKYHFLLLIFLLAGTVRCMKNDFLGRDTLGCRPVVYLSVQMGAFAILTVMICEGLWINVVLTVIFTILLYKKYRKKNGFSYAGRNLVLICIFCETMGYLFTKNWSTVSFSIAIAGFVAAMAGMWAVHRKTPYQKSRSPVSALIICGTFLCVCAAAASVHTPDPARCHIVQQIRAMDGGLTITRLADDRKTETTLVQWNNIWEESIQ